MTYNSTTRGFSCEAQYPREGQSTSFYEVRHHCYLESWSTYGITGVFATLHLGWNRMPANPRPFSSATVCNCTSSLPIEAIRSSVLPILTRTGDNRQTPTSWQALQAWSIGCKRQTLELYLKQMRIDLRTWSVNGFHRRTAESELISRLQRDTLTFLQLAPETKFYCHPQPFPLRSTWNKHNLRNESTFEPSPREFMCEFMVAACFRSTPVPGTGYFGEPHSTVCSFASEYQRSIEMLRKMFLVGLTARRPFVDGFSMS